MKWSIKYLPEAVNDLKELAGNPKILVAKALEKVSTNPLPVSEGGYGKPLGNHSQTRLSGLLKIKLKDAGILIVYSLIRTETEMIIVVIGARADDEVYDTAQRRVQKHDL